MDRIAFEALSVRAPLEVGGRIAPFFERTARMPKLNDLGALSRMIREQREERILNKDEFARRILALEADILPELRHPRAYTARSRGNKHLGAVHPACLKLALHAGQVVRKRFAV